MATRDAQPSLAERWAGVVRDVYRVRLPGARPFEFPVTDRPYDGRVLAYRLDDGWQLVTAGLARPDRTLEPAVTGVSGLGVELTIRLPTSDEPPGWATALLVTLADQVVQTGRPYLPGHRLQNSTPLDGRSPATCLLFAADRLVHKVDGPTGGFEFVQVVPVTPEEHARAQAEGTETVLDELRAGSPDLVAQLAR